MNELKNDTEIKPTSFYARVPADTNLYLVDIGNKKFNYGEEVLIKTEFGKDLAFITSFLFEGKETKKAYKSGAMLRYPTDEDKEAKSKKSKETYFFKSRISKLAAELKLKMNITHVLLPLYGKTVVVYYVAKGRVDFRELLISLKAEFKQRVVLRQISPQDRTKLFAPDYRVL